MNLLSAIEDAMWAQDLEKLNELAHCDCCCDEHYSYKCPALIWNGCRGSRSVAEDKEYNSYLRAFPNKFVE